MVILNSTVGAQRYRTTMVNVLFDKDKGKSSAVSKRMMSVLFAFPVAS